MFIWLIVCLWQFFAPSLGQGFPLIMTVTTAGIILVDYAYHGTVMKITGV